MEVVTCCTNKCKYEAAYYNSEEDSYYCEYCAHAFFNPNECCKIGSISIIRLMIRINRNLLKNINDYINQEQLGAKWKIALEQLKNFDSKVEEIYELFENTLKNCQLKDLCETEQQSLDLKYCLIIYNFQITESEIYRKYLLHQDINRFRLNDENISEAQIIRDVIDTKYKKEKVITKETFQNEDNQSEVNSLTNFYIEENKIMNAKKICDEEQTIIRIKDLDIKNEDKKMLPIRKDQEINSIECFSSIKDEIAHSISYDEFNSLYEKLFGHKINLNSNDSMEFFLNEENWMSFINSLSSYILPEINCYYLHYTPDDSDVVRTFIQNSIPYQKDFCFNYFKNTQIDGSKYLEALKCAARRTSNQFYICYTNLSSEEFCEIVSAGKNCSKLWFYSSLIKFDEECEFGEEIEGCKISSIYFNHSGSSNYSDWSNKPIRLNNLIAAISRCEYLTKSLKEIQISNCDISDITFGEILDRYKLNSIKILY